MVFSRRSRIAVMPLPGLVCADSVHESVRMTRVLGWIGNRGILPCCITIAANPRGAASYALRELAPAIVILPWPS